MEKAKIKKLAFWPAFILLIGAIILNIVNEEAFTAVFNTLNNLFMTKLGWLAALAAIVCVAHIIAGIRHTGMGRCRTYLSYPGSGVCHNRH